MAKKQLKIKVDTINGLNKPEGTIKQLDSVFFNVEITEAGEKKDLTSQQVKLFARKSDGKIVEQTTGISITEATNGQLTIDLLNAAVQVPGYVYFELEISDNGGTISTANFIYKVISKVASDEAIESTNEVATLKKIEEYVAQAKVELQKFKELQDAMLETNNSLNNQEELRVEAESLRATAEADRVSAETKREEAFNKVEGRITANTEELETARTATTGETFNNIDERIDCEVNRINKKIEISFLEQEDSESHTIENTVEGMTTDMIVKGKTLFNIHKRQMYKFSTSLASENFESSSSTNSCEVTIKNFEEGKYYFINAGAINYQLLKPNTEYTVLADATDGLIPSVRTDSSTYPLTSATTPFKNGIATFTTNDLTTGDKRQILYITLSKNLNVKQHLKNVIILEGDWTQKYIPPYFEGIKSFGEQEDKLSILSTGKNLLDLKKVKGGISSTKNDGETLTFNANSAFQAGGSIDIELNEAKRYYISCESERGSLELRLYKKGSSINTIVANESPIENADKLNVTFSNRQNIGKVIFRNVQLEEGTKTSYQFYKEDKKDILLSSYGFDEGLRGIKNITDELNSIRSVAIKRIGKREYREGDLLLENVVTDKVNTYFILEEPIETPLTENINVKIFNEKTYVSFENPISGTSSFKAPVNATATISRLNRENKALEEENLSLRQDLESTALTLTDSDLALVKQNVDMDFRLMEVEFALDIPQAILSSDINFKNKKGEVKTMARTPYEMMKIVILSGDYDREDYMHKVGKYYERGRMTKEEHDELMSLMTADEVISK